jgi:uncharacterized protein YbbC (DUF1343 family)
MEHEYHRLHRKFRLPVISLYGDHKESLKVQTQELNDVDVLLCDLQDIGSRYYTFHCTIAWAMTACHESATKLMVVDRPNPINARTFEGNLVKEENFSFVGAYPLPNRHGFTMGELVGYVKNYFDISLDLEVVWMKEYDRSLGLDEIDLPFVPPSPNMPTVAAAQVYPGMCLLEGTNLSEGRGTCTPFQLVGAPYIEDEFLFKDELDALGFEGVIIRPCRFKPMFNKHAQQDCGGIFIHVTDGNKFMPLRFALGLISIALKKPGFSWRHDPYEFETERLAIDLLLGDERLRHLMEGGCDVKEIFTLIHEEEKSFAKLREKYLRY